MDFECVLDVVVLEDQFSFATLGQNAMHDDPPDAGPSVVSLIGVQSEQKDHVGRGLVLPFIFLEISFDEPNVKLPLSVLW